MMKLVLTAISLAVAAAIFFLFTRPSYDEIKLIQQEMARYDQALDKAAELQRRKQELLSIFNTFDPNNIARLQRMLPDHVDNVRLVLDLDNLAAAHGMALQNVVISEPASATGDSSVLGTIGAAREKFDSLTLRFSTRSTYDAFAGFLEDLESSLRLTDLIALTISPDISPEGVTEPTYRFDITIRTYWLK